MTVYLFEPGIAVITLVIVKSPTLDYPAGTVYKIDGTGPQVLGRGSKANVRIKHPKLSRKHIEFIPKEAGWRVKDLGSTNGSKLNGGAITESQNLRIGDRIRVGKFLFNVADVTAPTKAESKPKPESKPKVASSASGPPREDEMATEHIPSTEESDMVAEMEDLFD
jgi:pSer/pThr/pTyr-binding forkhead associated (FHA) protein